MERQRRGIETFQVSGAALPRNRRVAAIVRKPTAEACEILGVDRGTVARLRKDLSVPAPPSPWTKRVLSRLGKVPDAEIAAEIGLRVATVARKRQKLGISRRPAFWTPKEIALLGKLSDAEVARKIGRTESAVRQRRNLLNRQGKGE